ncbi:CAP domain-containing protein [Limnochorda pilosa]|uniref:CAP domain-containing protein n=1 Tax=Limnochorda pilosa TaxID=1555112 RepID=UPI00082E300E|nr:CAP domain-containing protein [Limnochorda pilosa]
MPVEATSPSQPPAPAPEPPQSGGDTAQAERYLVNATNAERAAAGRAALSVNGTLTGIARTKARDMAVNGYFDHISPTYGSPRDMMLAAGLNPKWWGENIGRGSSVEQIHQAFMESPGHRANILSAGYTEMGAGVVRQGGRVYVAEEFIQQR